MKLNINSNNIGKIITVDATNVVINEGITTEKDTIDKKNDTKFEINSLKEYLLDLVNKLDIATLFKTIDDKVASNIISLDHITQYSQLKQEYIGFSQLPFNFYDRLKLYIDNSLIFC